MVIWGQEFLKFTDFPLRLEKILKFPIKKVVLIQYQRVMEIDPGAHGIRLDVYAEALPVSLIRRAGLIQKSRGFSRTVMCQLMMLSVLASLLNCRRGMSIISIREAVIIHERVLKVKNNMDLEVEFVKLRERDEANYKAGKAAGFKEGALQEKRNIVKTMLGKCTVTDEDICEITGCTQEFIDSIRNSESTDM